MNRGVMRRLEVAEKKLGLTIQAKYVVLDFDGRFFGDAGLALRKNSLMLGLSRKEWMSRF